MGKQIEKIRRWIADEPAEQDAKKTSIDIAVERALSRLLRNLVPALLIALAIDLAIRFIVSVDMAMSRWFQLVDLLSIVISCISFKLFKSLYRHPAY